MTVTELPVLTVTGTCGNTMLYNIDGKLVAFACNHHTDPAHPPGGSGGDISVEDCHLAYHRRNHMYPYVNSSALGVVAVPHWRLLARSMIWRVRVEATTTCGYSIQTVASAATRATIVACSIRNGIRGAARPSRHRLI